MTKALPFTQASICRRIEAARRAGLYVIGITADGTVLTAEKPVDAESFVSEKLQSSKWQDVEV
jgi:hypothetical protein